MLLCSRAHTPWRHFRRRPRHVRAERTTLTLRFSDLSIRLPYGAPATPFSDRPTTPLRLFTQPPTFASRTRAAGADHMARSVAAWMRAQHLLLSRKSQGPRTLAVVHVCCTRVDASSAHGEPSEAAHGDDCMHSVMIIG